ncbi:hypothetical protein [Streptomyces alanosinicus]
MAAAAALLPPAADALLQKGIDVAVILNALRALHVDQATRPALTPAAEALIHRSAAEQTGPRRRQPCPDNSTTCALALQGLNAVLRLHFTQEGENYFSPAP